MQMLREEKFDFFLVIRQKRARNGDLVARIVASLALQRWHFGLALIGIDLKDELPITNDAR